MPRSVLLTTLALSALAALGGYTLGVQHNRQVQDLSGLVNAVAEAHVAEHGGDVATCMGWVVEGEDMPRVRCGDVVYRIDATGTAIPIAKPGI